MKDKTQQVADQIKGQGKDAVDFARGYLDANTETGKRSQSIAGESAYRRGYLAGILDSDLVNGVGA